MSSAEEKKCFLYHEAKAEEYKNLARNLKDKLYEIDNIAYVLENILHENKVLNNYSGKDSSRGAIVDDFTMEMEIQISQYTELKDTMERCIEALHKKKDRAIELEEYHSQEKTKADTRYREALRKEEEERRRREEEERRRREEEWKRKMEELRKNMKVII